MKLKVHRGLAKIAIFWGKSVFLWFVKVWVYNHAQNMQSPKVLIFFLNLTCKVRTINVVPRDRKRHDIFWLGYLVKSETVSKVSFLCGKTFSKTFKNIEYIDFVEIDNNFWTWIVGDTGTVFGFQACKITLHGGFMAPLFPVLILLWESKQESSAKFMRRQTNKNIH